MCFNMFCFVGIPCWALALSLLMHGGLFSAFLLGHVAPPRLATPLHVNLWSRSAASESAAEATPPAGIAPRLVARSPVLVKTGAASGQTVASATAGKVLAQNLDARASSGAARPIDADPVSASVGFAPSAIPAESGDVLSPDISEAGASSSARFDASYLHNPPPEYPVVARRRGEEGIVLLNVVVCAEGRALHVELRSSSGSIRLDRAALNSVRNWRFVPAIVRGQAVVSRIVVPIVFNIEG